MQREFKGSRGRLFARMMELYASKAVPVVKLSEVASLAGVSRGTVYRHIPSHPPLYEQLSRFHMASLQEMAIAACEDVKDPAIRCATFIFECMRRAEAEPSWCKFSLRYAVVDPVMFRAFDKAVEHVMSPISMPAPQTTTIERREVVFLIFAGMQAVRFGDDDWRQAGLKCVRRVLKVGNVPPEVVESLLRRYP